MRLTTNDTHFMKTLFTFYFTLLVSCSFAQIDLKGKITDHQNKGIDFLEVVLLDHDSVLVAENVTDSTGNFHFTISPNDYILRIEEFGQTLAVQNLNVKENTTLPTIIIQRTEVNLNEAVVEGKAKTYERFADRMVFNVENSITALGGDALDALKATPGVTVSNSAIEITGKSSVNVMIDDRIIQMSAEDLQNYLKGIPSSNIKKIEVITNPPAKYEASGNSGLINIVLKDARMDAWSATLRSSYQQAHQATYQYGANFSYDKNKFSALVDLYGNNGKWRYQRDAIYHFEDSNMIDDAKNVNHFRNLGGGTTLNYKLNDKTTVGLQYYGGYYDPEMIENNQTNRFDLDNTMLTNEATNGSTKTFGRYHQLNLNYNLKLDTIGKKFSIDVDYWNSNSEKSNAFLTQMERFDLGSFSNERVKNNSDQTMRNFAGKFDFYLPYDFGTLELGAKASFTQTENLIDVLFASDLYPDFSNHNQFKYQENVQALYASFAKKLGEKWNFKVGLRGEYTQTMSDLISENTTSERDYFKLFPTAYLQYKPWEDHSFSVNFGRRINRPGFWEMNPARQYSNRYSYNLGNPFMQPSFTYNYEFNYNYKGILDLTAYYQDAKDGFGQMFNEETVIENGENVKYRVYRRLNYYDTQRLGINLSANVKPIRGWESNNSLAMMHNKSVIHQTEEKYSGNIAWFSSYNNFTLNAKKTFLAELNFNYQFGGNNREFEISSSSYLDFGFKYLMFDKRLTLGIMFEDTLKTDYNTMKTNINNIYLESKQKYDTHLFRLSVSYRFGSDKINVNKRQTSNADEAGRGSN